MFNIYLNIRNPWSNFFKTGYVWTGNLFRHKFWELQAMRTSDVICFKIDITHRQDHAGFHFELGLFSFNVAFMVYDNRHWNHIENTWNINV